MTPIVPSVTVPVTLPDTGVVLTPFIVSGLAREIAMNIREPEEILETFKISPEAYEKLKANEFFTKLVDAARIEWQSATNTIARTQIEAAALVEQAMPDIFLRMKNKNEPLNHVVDAGKWLSDIGGLKKDPTKGQPGERFQITINLGADTKLEFDGSRLPIVGPALASLPAPDDKEERV
jgi:hypothetical protein